MKEKRRQAREKKIKRCRQTGQQADRDRVAGTERKRERKKVGDIDSKMSK